MNDTKSTQTLAYVCLLLLALVFAPSGIAKIDPETAVGIWLFDEGKGDTVADSSGNGNDGELKNDPKWVDGKLGKGLEFEFALNNYVIVPIPHSDSVTVAMWAKYSALPTANSGLFHAQATEDPGGDPATKLIGIWVENSKKLWGRLIPPGGNTINFPKEKDLDADKWHHIALTADESSKKGVLWVDGKAVGEIDYGGKIGDFTFAKIGRQGTETWSGVIDEVAFFNVPLEEGDIQSLMGGLEQALTVSDAGKLATIWGAIKISP